MNNEPIPHWPGEFVLLGDYQVFVRHTPSASDNPRSGGWDGGPEPALFVHGLAGSSRNWTDLMDELRPRLDCAALDLPGFGDSPPRPDGKYSVSALAHTVATFIEHQDRGPVHLIGNSFGGAVAVKVAAKRPWLVRSLTLVAPALPDLRPRPNAVRFPVMSIPRLGGWALSKFNTLSPERRVANVLANCYYDPASAHPARFAAEVAALTHRDTLSYADAALIGLIRTLTAESLRVGAMAPWRDAARITVPTLVIYGSHDRLVSPRMAGRAARAFRGSRVVVLPRTGHVAMMERPAAVAAEIAMLLRGPELTAGIPAHSSRLTDARALGEAPRPL